MIYDGQIHFFFCMSRLQHTDVLTDWRMLSMTDLCAVFFFNLHIICTHTYASICVCCILFYIRIRIRIHICTVSVIRYIHMHTSIFFVIFVFSIHVCRLATTTAQEGWVEYPLRSWQISLHADAERPCCRSCNDKDPVWSTISVCWITQ